MSASTFRRLMAASGIGLYIAAMFYPFQLSFSQGLLGPLGQMLFFYVLIGWQLLLVGDDPTGVGAPFAFFSPWPTLNVLLAIPLLFCPAFGYWIWVRIATGGLAIFSLVVAWRFAEFNLAIPLVLWSIACIWAAIAVNTPTRPEPLKTKIATRVVKPA